jgi:hypothetical protein
MPKQRNRRGGELVDRVREQTERRALKQASLVPWKRLAEASEEYTDWQVFTLWLRAVVESAGSIPPIVEEELDSRMPGLLGRVRRGVEAAVKNGDSAGARIWQDVSRRVEIDRFVGAKRAGWLDAVRYYSSMSLRSMKAWSHWENSDKQWRAEPPKYFPNYARWQSEVADVAKLSNPNSTAQQVLDAVRGISDAEWSKLLNDFSDLITFALWMELVLDIEGPTSALVSKELANRYSGFSLSRTLNSKAVVRALSDWALEHALAIADQKHMLAALSFHVSHHPAYRAMRSYALHCHEVWPSECPDHLPSFEEWRQVADEHFEE